VARFTGAVFALYVIAATPLLFAKLVLTGDLEWEGDPTRHQASRVYWMALLVGLVLPLYALGVYPTISQQVGGGKMVPVHVLTCNDEVSEWLASSSATLYLVDRASENSLFLVTERHSRRIVEIANSELQAITYSQSWRSSKTRHP
jgi:hypothetical protein